MDPSLLYYIILGIIIFDFVLEQWLDSINQKSYKPIIPAEFVGFFSEEKYKTAYEYQSAKNSFGKITATLSFIISLSMISLGLFGWLDNQLIPYIASPLFRGLAFFGILFIANDIITLPFQWYDTFVIEQKFGFNKSTQALFWVDKIKGWALTVVVGGLVLGALLWLVESFQQNFWVYFWAVVAVLMLFVNMFYASWIIPLFNKLSPLEDGPLRQAIEEYSKKNDFPLTNILVINGSKRSTKANAFFSGLGSQKKVVLYDTLIEQQSQEELLAILAHEVGHYKKKHLQVGLVLSIVQTGLILFLASRFIFSPALTQAMGGTGTVIYLNLLAFGLLFNPISTIIGIFMNVFSRKNEFEADEFAARTYSGESLGTALKKLSVENLSNLTPHPYYVFMHYSHPPVLERLKALQKIK